MCTPGIPLFWFTTVDPQVVKSLVREVGEFVRHVGCVSNDDSGIMFRENGWFSFLVACVSHAPLWVLCTMISVVLGPTFIKVM
jgi:hypothetical protein